MVCFEALDCFVFSGFSEVVFVSFFLFYSNLLLVIHWYKFVWNQSLIVMRYLKYFTTYLPAAAVAISFLHNDLWSWFAVVFVFMGIPILELLLGVSNSKLDEGSLALRANDKLYDYMLYIIVPVQWVFVVWFCFSMRGTESTLTVWEWFGKVMAMGILCGSFGINVAHELGHRSKKMERFLAKTLLLSSLYTHFYIEHNRGHHKHVGTPEDPSTARLNETVYLFWFRSMLQTWLSAWRIENERMRRNGWWVFGYRNEMLRFQLMQGVLVFAVYCLFGWWATFSFWLAALIGGVFLETINYIEHYGLMRKKLLNGQYELVEPKHSWNSNHLLGRLILFELSRHSDHHYKSHKKYQTLESIDHAPQMPTGYPGMMVLSLFCPLWFWVMNRRVRAYSEEVIA
jgi:alkane 1-monooxygenase